MKRQVRRKVCPCIAVAARLGSISGVSRGAHDQKTNGVADEFGEHKSRPLKVFDCRGLVKCIPLIFEVRLIEKDG